MITLVQKKEVDIIIVKEVDRLNRNTFEWYRFLKLTKKSEVQIYVYLNKTYYQAEHDLHVGIKAILAEEYSRNLSEKVNEAHRRRQESGSSAIFTNNTWGYKTIIKPDGSKELVGDEEEAKMIKLIFKLIIEGNGGYRISEILYKMGYRNRNGKQIGQAVIIAIVRNPKVTGTIIVNKTHWDFEQKETVKNPKSEWVYIDNVVPAIIDKETYQLANEILDGRRREAKTDNKIVGSNYGKELFSNKLFCGECGEVYYRNSRLVKSGRIYEWFCSRYYRHGRKTINNYKKGNCKDESHYNGDGCDSITVKENDLYQILEEVRNEYFYTVNQDNLITEALKYLKKTLSSSDYNVLEDRSSIENEIKKIDDRIDELLDTLLDGIIPRELYKKKAKSTVRGKAVTGGKVRAVEF